MEETLQSGIKMTDRSRRMRIKIAEMISSAGASHVGSCFSMVELLNVIFDAVDLDKIRHSAPDRDRVIVSKGHSACAVYVAMAEHGLFPEQDLMNYGKNDTYLSGHVSHFIPRIEHSTGALGHGLPVAVGISVGFRSKGYSSARCFVVVGDGEMNEGSNWEALMLAGHLKLNNLCVLVDDNGMGGVGQTSAICSLAPLKEKFLSFGLDVVEVDGHDEDALKAALGRMGHSSRPLAVIARTVKGKGASFMEGKNVWHYRPPKKEDCEKLRTELLGG